MYEMLGICLGLAALLTFNALASLLATGLWRVVGVRSRGASARVRAAMLFALRIIPAAVALIAVVTLLIPSYLKYEPYSTDEGISLKLGIISLISATGLILACWRGLASWRATRALMKEWMREAVPVSIAGVSIPAYRIRHPFPVIAVVGTVRPCLFVAGSVLDALSDEEMSAAVAHECGHLAARDNLKRILLRACRDVLTIVPCGRSLDRAWAENAEAAADEYAANLGPAVALNLASALINIARMIPAGARPTMPVGAFLLGDEDGGIRWRVRRLIDLAASGTIEGRSDAQGDGSLVAHLTLWAGWIMAGGLLLAAWAFTVTSTHALVEMHAALEQAVRLLN
jgi:Zn-dependent protease with chaperone function